jgi:hypothetical protein
MDFRMIGAPELEHAIKDLEKAVQKRIVNKVLRNSQKRVKKRIIANISGPILGVDTGVYRRAWQQAKIRSASSKPRTIKRLGIEWPSRASLGISPQDKNYYPIALEYGYLWRPKGKAQTTAERSAFARGSYLERIGGAYKSGKGRRGRPAKGGAKIKNKTVRPFPHIRPAIDNHYERELVLMRMDMGKEIEKEWAKLARKQRAAARHASATRAFDRTLGVS